MGKRVGLELRHQSLNRQLHWADEREIDRSAVDCIVYPSKTFESRIDHMLHTLGVGHIDFHSPGPVFRVCRELPALLCCFRRAFKVDVCEDHPSSASFSKCKRGVLTDPTRGLSSKTNELLSSLYYREPDIRTPVINATPSNFAILQTGCFQILYKV